MCGFTKYNTNCADKKNHDYFEIQIAPQIASQKTRSETNTDIINATYSR
jgi:hypothetical protein